MGLKFKVNVVVESAADGKIVLKLPGKKRALTINEADFLESYKPDGKISMDALLPKVDRTHLPTWTKDDVYSCRMCTRVLVGEDGLTYAAKRPCYMDTMNDPQFIWG